MKIQPLSDRVLVKRFPEETQTSSGIVIPDSAKEKPSKGEVKHVGKGKLTEDGKRLEMEVKVGDQVLFGKYAGQETAIDGEELLVMHESDIVAIVN